MSGSYRILRKSCLMTFYAPTKKSRAASQTSNHFAVSMSIAWMSRGKGRKNGNLRKEQPVPAEHHRWLGCRSFLPTQPNRILAVNQHPQILNPRPSCSSFPFHILKTHAAAVHGATIAIHRNPSMQSARPDIHYILQGIPHDFFPSLDSLVRKHHINSWILC